MKPKQFYIDRIDAHAKADNLIRGQGWNGYKGCAIGCTLENYSHEEFEKQGLAPKWFAHVEDVLFEGMSAEKSRTWPKDCLTAIPDYLHGDVKNPVWDKIKAQFLLIILNSALGSFDHMKFPKVKKAIEMSIKLWQREDIGSPDFKADAADAARYAADAAYAAYAARYAAYAADAADAARYAARYAAYAAYAARYAAYAAYAADAADAARTKKYDFFADELLKILKETK